MALEITDANFEETVLKSDKPVIVDFWAAWCGPCRMVGPIIDEISQDYEVRLWYAKWTLIFIKNLLQNMGLEISQPYYYLTKENWLVGKLA